MVARKGYKLTEAGEIPEDWEVVKLSEIGIFKDGSTFPLAYQGNKEGEYPFFKVSDMSTNANSIFMKIANNYISKKTQQIFKPSILPKNSIIFAKIGEAIFQERKRILTVDSCIDNNLSALIIDRDKANYKYIYQLLQIICLGSYVRTTALPSLANKTIENIKILLPPLAEQAAIADALSDMDAFIGTLEQIIAKKRLIKQGAMRDLLTGRKRLPGFKEEWQIINVKEALTICYGKSQQSVESSNGTYPIMASGGQIGYACQYLCDTPSVLIGRKGTIDKPQYINVPFWAIDTLFYSIFNKNHHPKFYYYLFCTINWQNYNEASGVPSLNARIIEAVEVCVPNIAEQTEIASVLSGMDAEIELLENRLAKARQIKAGMMAELLTGRIRLV